MKPFANSFWYKPLPTSPAIHANSDKMVAELVKKSLPVTDKWSGASISVTSYSVRLHTATSTTPLIYPVVTDAGYSNPINVRLRKGVRVPIGAKISNGTDAHLAVYDPIADVYADFWRAEWVSGKLRARWGGVIDKASLDDGVHTAPYGARATGLPVTMGVITPSMLATSINQVVAMSIPRPMKGHVWPANRDDGFDTASCIKEGQRFFFPQSVVINTSWPPLLKKIVTAIKTNGVIVVDRSDGMCLYLEEPLPGTDPYAAYKGGLACWYIMQKLFPWKLLKAVA